MLLYPSDSLMHDFIIMQEIMSHGKKILVCFSTTTILWHISKVATEGLYNFLFTTKKIREK